MIKEQFINKVIQTLEDENRGGKSYNIPFIIAPLEQRLHECEDFLKDLQNHNYHIIVLDVSDEDYYTNAKLHIAFYDNEEDNGFYYNYLNFSYTIDCGKDKRYWGYCECCENDKDYDSRYKCCGHGCDWVAPNFSITKQYNCGTYNWKGDEHDYWDFKDKFNNVTLEEKKILEKKTKIKSLEEQIKILSEELHKLSE